LIVHTVYRVRYSENIHCTLSIGTRRADAKPFVEQVLKPLFVIASAILSELPLRASKISLASNAESSLAFYARTG